MTHFDTMVKRAGSAQRAMRLLGISHSAWYRYQKPNATVPPYISASLLAHLSLSEAAFERLIESYYG